MSSNTCYSCNKITTTRRLRTEFKFPAKIKMAFSQMSNLKKAACASKRDVLELATLRYASNLCRCNRMMEQNKAAKCLIKVMIYMYAHYIFV